MIEQQRTSVTGPPLGSLPVWGQRVCFEEFFVELVPAGERSLNVRLKESFASISFGPDAGASSLAGDRLRRYDRRAYEYIIVPSRFPLRGESVAAPEVLAFVFEFEMLRPDIAAGLQIAADDLQQRVIIGGPKPLTTQIAQRIRRQMMTGCPSRWYLKSLCMVMMVEMLRLPLRQQTTRRGTTLSDRVLQSILDYIDANLDADLSIDSLASLAGVRTHTFSRAFKRMAGEPPHQYVLTRRIEAARSLLKSSNHSLADIAFTTGFSSQSHMTTTFQREIGTTPAKLRSGKEN
jgi:AraC family transcriptional regulator